MPFQKTHFQALCLAGVLACALPALAQEVDIDIENLLRERAAFIGQQAAADQAPNKYRIGIDCGELPRALASHLRLQEGTGLLVNNVLGESPAGRAGIKRHDVILEANGHPLANVMDLVAAVNEAKDSEMSLTVIHAGEEKVFEITPEERDEEEVTRLRNGFANRLGQGFAPGVNNAQIQAEMERAFEQMQKQLGQFGGMNQGWRRLGPGIMFDFDTDMNSPSAMMPPGFSQSWSKTSRMMTTPNGEELSIEIDRNNDKPATVKVKRGSKSWELTEKDLDKLPADIRPIVESQLNGGRGIQGIVAPRLPGLPTRPRQVARPPAAPRADEQKVQDRFDGLELQMKELQDAIRSIQGNK